MNLQLVSPYKQCPYNCPFCCASVSMDYPWKKNMYTKNKTKYFQNLLRIIREQNITTVVITGDTEPTLFYDWIEECLGFIRAFYPDIIIELQTKNYNTKPLDIDRIRYSIASELDYYRAINSRQYDNNITGFTYLLSKELEVNTIKKLIKKEHGAQHTIKVLQSSQTGNVSIDTWINNKHLIPTMKEIEILQSEYNTWVDVNCMDTKDRYFIYRIDGTLYRNWSELPD